MSLTLPSAGATIRLGSAGVGRFGSRKKAIVKRKSDRRMSDNHAETNQTATPADARIRRIQRASKRVCERIRESHLPGSKSHGQVAIRKPLQAVVVVPAAGHN